MPTHRIQIISDLHHEKMPGDLLDTVKRNPAADVLIVAGDIGKGVHECKALKELAQKDRPVVVVFGNNCIEGYRVDELEKLATELSDVEQGFYVLHRQSVVALGIRFLGAILWTDGQFVPAGTTQAACHQACGAKGFGQAWQSEGVPFSFDASIAEHHLDLAYLQAELAKPFSGPTVVVTHHLLHPACADRRFKNSPASCAYVSELEHSLIESCALWVHGHTHSSVDFRLNDTRIVANPRGSSTEAGKWGNPEFDPFLIVEL